MPNASHIGSLLLRALLPLGILAAGSWGYSILSIEEAEDESPPPQTQKIRTRVTELQVQDLPVVVRTNGIVQPHNEVTISAQVAGQVKTISPYFEVGAYFAKGDVLIELDQRDYKTALAIAEAEELGAQSALQLEQANYARVKKLFDKQVVSDVELNQAVAARDQAAARLDSVSAQVDQAQRDLERTKVNAPFAGRVRQKTVGPGQSVAPGAPLGVVFAVDYAEIRLPIAGTELQYLSLPEIESDAPVDVEFTDAIQQTSDTVWHGRIVRTEGTLDEDSLELFAIAQVMDPFGRTTKQPPLRIGQPVVAAITGRTLQDVIALPRAAVRQLDQIILVDADTLTLTNRTVEPVWSDANQIYIRDPDISAGQLLATTRIVFAPDGAAVEIIPDIEIAESSDSETAKPTVSKK